MIKTLLLVFMFTLTISCSTGSHKKERLMRENPNCQVNDDAELVCPLPWDEEMLSETCTDDCGSMSQQELDQLLAKKKTPKKKKSNAKKPKRQK